MLLFDKRAIWRARRIQTVFPCWWAFYSAWDLLLLGYEPAPTVAG